MNSSEVDTQSKVRWFATLGFDTLTPRAKRECHAWTRPEKLLAMENDLFTLDDEELTYRVALVCQAWSKSKSLDNLLACIRSVIDKLNAYRASKARGPPPFKVPDLEKFGESVECSDIIRKRKANTDQGELMGGSEIDLTVDSTSDVETSSEFSESANTEDLDFIDDGSEGAAGASIDSDSSDSSDSSTPPGETGVGKPPKLRKRRRARPFLVLESSSDADAELDSDSGFDVTSSPTTFAYADEDLDLDFTHLNTEDLISEGSDIEGFVTDGSAESAPLLGNTDVSQMSDIDDTDTVTFYPLRSKTERVQEENRKSAMDVLKCSRDARRKRTV